jgi:hypothetical protein
MKKKVAAIGLSLSLLILCSPVSIACSRDSGPPCSGYGCPGSEWANSSQSTPSKHPKSKYDRNALPFTDQDRSASYALSR